MEHDPVEIWERTSAVIQTALDTGRPDGVRPGRGRASPTSARPPSSGTAAPAAPLQRHRLAGHPHRPHRRDAGARRRGRRDPTQGRAAARHLLLRRQDPVDPGERRRRTGGGRARRRALRQHRHAGCCGTSPAASTAASTSPTSTNASRTMLMNLETLDWDDELLGFFGIPRAMLPQISRARTRTGYGDHAGRGPFGGEVPLTGDLGDQQAATVGQVCFAPGEAKNTYGTGNFMLLNTGTELVRSQVRACSRRSATNSATSRPSTRSKARSPSPARRCSGCATSSASSPARRESEALARQVEDNGGVYFVPAFSGLFAPYWRSDARGAIVGLSRFNTNAHLARATLEAICYQTRDVAEAMESRLRGDARRAEGRRWRHGQRAVHADPGRHARRAGQPARSCARRPRSGAAYAAGLAVGFWPPPTSCGENWHEGGRWEPAGAPSSATRATRQWRKAVERT